MNDRNIVVTVIITVVLIIGIINTQYCTTLLGEGINFMQSSTNFYLVLNYVLPFYSSQKNEELQDSDRYIRESLSSLYTKFHDLVSSLKILC